MKIGIISDTHGNVEIWENIKNSIFKDVDIILHSGDILNPGPKNPISIGYNPSKLAQSLNESKIPILIAKGNCDSEVDQSLLNIPIEASYILYERNNLKIFVTHGHNFDEEKKLKLAKQYKINVFIYGHTHRNEIFEKEGIVFLNPGSPTIPFDNTHSVGIIEENRIYIVEIIQNKIIKEICLFKN